MLNRRDFFKLAALCGAGIMFAPSLGCASDKTDYAHEERGTGTSVGGANPPTEQAPATATRFVFDTVVDLRAWCSQELLDEAAARCEYFDSIFSRTREGSDIYRINNAGGSPTAVQPETADIITQGIAFGESTKGLFDITIGAASSLWDFHDNVIPDPDVLAEAVRHVDYRGITVQASEQSTVTLADPAAMLDLGGIAKGYIADDLAHFLRNGGCESALINLGGDVYALGRKPDGTPWNVGIQDPLAATGKLSAVVEAHNLSVVTSGLYERGFEHNGTWYHHILDSRTGYPCTTDIKGTSILSPRSLEGDIYATVCVLLGTKAALEFCESMADVEALFINENGEITATRGAVYREAQGNT